MNNRANTLGVLGDIRNIVLYLKSKNIDFAVLKELQNGITSLNFLIIFKNDEALLTQLFQYRFGEGGGGLPRRQDHQRLDDG